MSSFLKSISLFPETKLWRIKGEPEVKHAFGGAATIIMFAIICTILAFKLIEVFKKDTIIVTTDKTIHVSNVLGTVTTSQNNPQIRPLMFGV